MDEKDRSVPNLRIQKVFPTKKQSTMLTQQRSLEISLDDCLNERAKIHTGGLRDSLKTFK